MTLLSNASNAAIVGTFAQIPALLDQAAALTLRGRILERFRRYIAPVLNQILKQTIFDKQGEQV